MISWYRRYRDDCISRGKWWFWAVEHHPGLLYLGFFCVYYHDEWSEARRKTVRRYSLGWNRD